MLGDTDRLEEIALDPSLCLLIVVAVEILAIKALVKPLIKETEVVTDKLALVDSALPHDFSILAKDDRLDVMLRVKVNAREIVELKTRLLEDATVLP